MKNIFLVFILICCVIIASGELDFIIEKAEKNIIYKNIHFTSKMIVVDEGNEMDMKINIYVKNENNVFAEVVESSVGHTTRFLKKDGQLWLYIPSAGKTVRIKGHMLKEGFMGSNFTYEDISENRKLRDIYDIEVIEDSLYYILNMTAKVKDAPYNAKKTYIDKNNYALIKDEIYSSSGRLLKTFDVYEHVEVNEKYVPKKVVIRDLLKKESYTEIIHESIKIYENINEQYFNKTYLER